MVPGQTISRVVVPYESYVFYFPIRPEQNITLSWVKTYATELVLCLYGQTFPLDLGMITNLASGFASNSKQSVCYRSIQAMTEFFSAVEMKPINPDGSFDYQEPQDLLITL